MESYALDAAKPGQVFNFDYEQPHSGETTRHLARVVAVRKLTKDDIARIGHQSWYRSGDSEFVRTETIVTCEMPNGKFRSFYGERTRNCRLSMFGRAVFALGLARFFCR
jgi:hypothetical protein